MALCLYAATHTGSILLCHSKHRSKPPAAFLLQRNKSARLNSQPTGEMWHGCMLPAANINTGIFCNPSLCTHGSLQRAHFIGRAASSCTAAKLQPGCCWAPRCLLQPVQSPSPSHSAVSEVWHFYCGLIILLLPLFIYLLLSKICQKAYCGFGNVTIAIHVRFPSDFCRLASLICLY